MIAHVPSVPRLALSLLIASGLTLATFHYGRKATQRWPLFALVVKRASRVWFVVVGYWLTVDVMFLFFRLRETFAWIVAVSTAVLIVEFALAFAIRKWRGSSREDAALATASQRSSPPPPSSTSSAE